MSIEVLDRGPMVRVSTDGPVFRVGEVLSLGRDDDQQKGFVVTNDRPMKVNSYFCFGSFCF